LKSTKTGKPVGNIGLPIGITGKPVSKLVNYFFKKIIFLKKSNSLTGLLKIGETGLNQFL
jgi:hypothetical protein